jgi:uncharacterized membrane protein
VHRINGVVVSAGTVIAVGVLSRVEVSVTFSAGGSTINQFGVGASANLGSAVVATISRPQIEFATQSTAYQRVTTAFDVTEAGQRDCYGVRADGTDDGYVTGSIDFSGTNKVTVFAAVRQAVTSGAGTIISSVKIGDPGRFAIGKNTGVDQWQFTSSGSTSVASGSLNVAASPATYILRGEGDISAPLTRIARQSTVVQNTASQGTGNYANSPLRLFFLVNTLDISTAFFNGDLYALIVAGGSYPLSTIQRVERLLSRITPTVNL